MTVSVEQTVATLLKRAAAGRAAQQARADATRARLRQGITESLAAGVEAWLIGSLAWGGFGERSDVDVVLRGAPQGHASRLELALTRLVGVPVEVLRLEELPASFRERVEREGIVLHGK